MLLIVNRGVVVLFRREGRGLRCYRFFYDSSTHGTDHLHFYLGGTESHTDFRFAGLL